MTIGMTALQQLHDVNDAASYATASYPPAANRLIVAFIATRGTNDTPTSVTGNGLTWSSIAAVNSGTGLRLMLYAALTGDSPSSGALTVAYTPTQTGQHISVFEFSGAKIDVSAADAIAQSPTNSGTATSGSVTFAALTSGGGNRLCTGWCHAANEATVPRAAGGPPPTNPAWTEIHDGSFATPASGMETQWLPSDLELTGGATWTTSSLWAGIGAEIKNACTVTTDLTRITAAESTTNWAALGGGAAGLVQETDFFIQGYNCISKNITGVGTLKGMWYDNGSGIDFTSGANTGKHVFIWIFVGTPQLCDTLANGGVRVRLGTDGSNYGDFYVDGGDTNIVGGWKRYVIDPTKTPSASTGTLNTASIRYYGALLLTTGAAKGNNLGIDAIDYGFGIKVTGTSTAVWDEILLADMGTGYMRWGVVQQVGGTLMARGRLTFGDNVGTLSMDVSDVSRMVTWEYQTYYQGGSVASMATALLKFLTVGNATGTTKYTDGVIVGSGDTAKGRSGSLFRALGGTVTVDFSASNVTNVKFYGSTFYGCSGGLTFSSSAGTNHEFMGCVIASCGIVTAGNVKIRTCTFSATTDASSDGSALLWNASINIMNCSFVANTHATNDPHAIKHTATGTFTYDSLIFTGNDYDIDNNSTGLVTVQNTATTSGQPVSNASTYENTGGGASTSIVTTVPISIHVQDEDTTSIEDACVYIQKTTPDAYTSGAGNDQGDLDFVITEAIVTDAPSSGWLIVQDVSTGREQTYRYTGYVTGTKTFALPTKIGPTACTGGGTSTSLQNSGTDFTTQNIKRGDTVRNETDGSWARVLVIAAVEITTTPLTGGGDNTWTSGDNYSFHSLAVAYVSGTDTVAIPFVNEYTNASGNVSTNNVNYGADRAITVRIRKSSSGSTRYQSYTTSGTLSSSGYPLTAVLILDGIAGA